MYKGVTIESDNSFEMLFEASDDMVLILDEDHRIIKSNLQFKKNFPCDEAKAHSNSFKKVVGKDSYLTIFRPTIEACIEKRRKATVSKWSDLKGVKKFFTWVFSPVSPESAPKQTILAVGKDLTQHEKLKNEALQKDMELKSLIQSKRDYVFFLNKSYQVFDCNNLGMAFAKEKSGYSFSLGDKIFDLIPHKLHAPLTTAVEEVLRSGNVIKQHKFFKRSKKHYEFCFKPIISLTGNIVGTIVIANDITVSKEAEIEMHLSRNKLKSYFDSSIQSIFLLGKNHEVIEFNKKASDDIRRIWNKELKIYDNILDYFSTALHDRFLEYFNRAISGEKFVIEQRIEYPTGPKIWSEITFVPVYHNAGEIMGASFSTLDITKHKSVESRLSENEANLISLVENNDTLVWSVDRNHELILLNSQAKEFFKLTFDADLQPGMNILECMDKSSQRYFKKQLSKVYQGMSLREDRRIKLPNQVVIIEFIMNPIVSGGKVIGASVFSMDVTERKQREIELVKLNKSYLQEIEIRKKTEEDLKFKNNELDTFIYKASHDLRGPIASLMGLYNAAAIEVKDKKSLEYLEYIHKTAQRMDQVLKALISLSEIKDKPISLELVSLPQVIKDTLDIVGIKNSLKNITFDLKVPDISFYTDEGLLLVIIQNLLENAIRYARLDVPTHIAIKAKITGKRELRLTVKDNGLGVEQEIQDKVFNMFYKGSNFSSGSGLGLYIVKSAADKLGGKVSLKSTVNKGTTVCIIFPEIGSPYITKGRFA